MDRRFYFDRLYPFQDEVLGRVAAADTEFYLTGGTAASRGYLNHRFSDDLDFFVNDDERFGIWAERLADALVRTGAHVEFVQKEVRLVRLQTWTDPEVRLKIDLINDVPARVGDVRIHPSLGRLDSEENILANKVSAALDRGEPKDIADIWGFCCVRGLSLTEALENASSKAAGIFPADLARVLLAASETDHRLVQWIDAPPCDRYLRELHSLGERLALSR